MIEKAKFCTIEFHPSGEKLMGTLYTDRNGVDKPKDLWFEDNWIPIWRVSKAIYNTGYTITGRYVESPEDYLE